MPKRFLPWLAATLVAGIGTVIAIPLGAPLIAMLAVVALAIVAYRLTKMKLGLYL